MRRTLLALLAALCVAESRADTGTGYPVVFVPVGGEATLLGFLVDVVPDVDNFKPMGTFLLRWSAGRFGTAVSVGTAALGNTITSSAYRALGQDLILDPSTGLTRPTVDGGSSLGSSAFRFGFGRFLSEVSVGGGTFLNEAAGEGQIGTAVPATLMRITSGVGNDIEFRPGSAFVVPQFDAAYRLGRSASFPPTRRWFEGIFSDGVEVVDAGNSTRMVSGVPSIEGQFRENVTTHHMEFFNGTVVKTLAEASGGAAMSVLSFGIMGPVPSSGPGTTRFIALGETSVVTVASAQQAILPVSTIGNLKCRLGTSVGAGTTTITAIKNGVATALSVVFTGAATTASDLVDTVAFNGTTDTLTFRSVGLNPNASADLMCTVEDRF